MQSSDNEILMDQSSAPNLSQQAMDGVENLINEQKTHIRNNQANSFIDQQSVKSGINGNSIFLIAALAFTLV